MGSRKRIKAEQRKEERKNLYIARLNNCPTSPRKMRLVADMVRGQEVERALFLLKTSPKHASRDLYKLVQSAIANWESKRGRLKLQERTLKTLTEAWLQRQPKAGE